MQFFIAHLVGFPDVLHSDQRFSFLRSMRLGPFAVAVFFFHKSVHSFSGESRVESGEDERWRTRISTPQLSTLDYVLLAASPSFLVCFFTMAPSLSVFKTRLGPVMTSWPGSRPVRIWRSDSPIMPVVTSINFALLPSRTYTPVIIFGFSPGFGTSPWIVGARSASGFLS